ncbi:MAG: SPFH domain-containing protein [Alphaproteobacteria bacterium]|nr:SPFH domain-containing protein [Alphaproteobacteria bacterium]MCB9691233.1 SPFH domain-containing protein [Alphaproteobacteria bacterium]
MGLWSTLKQHAGAQFLDVIEWLDNTNDTLVWRFPVFNQAITDNSKLVVREGQAAVFVSEGRLSDVFGPGTYTLDTRNTPITSFFKSIAYALQYPYKGDIYFVSTRQFTDNGWGTATPIMLRDAEFGPVRIRAYGVFSYRITDPAEFLRQIVGTDGLFTTDEINGQLKKKLVAGFASAVGKAKIPILDLAANYLEMGDQLATSITPTMQSSYGISLTDFTIQSISLPEAVEKALDERSKMGVLGDLNAYTQLQAAESIKTAAANTGLGGAGIGMGVGFGMGNMMGNTMGNAFGGGGQFNPQTGMQGGMPPGPPPPPPAATFHYSGPAGQGQKSLDELVAIVSADRNGAHNVWMQGWPGWKSVKEVPEVMSRLPPPVAAPPPFPAAASYHYNGSGGSGEMGLDQVVAAVKGDPSGKHHVWQQGWDGWKLAQDVPEIAGKLSAGPPPPPPM